MGNAENMGEQSRKLIMEGQNENGILEKISGPVVTAKNMMGTAMYELVQVGDLKLTGEVIRIEGEFATIQVYEETAGLRQGDPVVRLGMPLSVELGPGLLGQMFDGILRPLEQIKEKAGGIYIPRGINVDALPKHIKWRFQPTPGVGVGSRVSTGSIIGTVDESKLMVHRIMINPNCPGGTVKSFKGAGEYTVDEEIMVIEGPDGNEYPIM